MVLAGLKEQYPNLYYTTIPLDKRFRHSKKLAVNIGVKAAKMSICCSPMPIAIPPPRHGFPK
jgi:hypothetical protein